MMNILKQNKRSQRGLKPDLDYLDCRIVPAVVSPHMVVAADLAHADLSVHSAQVNHATASATAEISISREQRLERREQRLERREQRLERRMERHEMVVERRELRLARLDALREARHGGTLPLTNLLPPNESQQLDLVYEEFLIGDLPTTTNQSGQPVIQGTNVEVQIHTNSPSDFDSTVAAAVSSGLQVTINDPAYDIVLGFLPIAQLPAVAQIAGAPSLTAVDYPATGTELN